MTRGSRGALALSGCLLLLVFTAGDSSAGWPPSQKLRGAKAPEAAQTRGAVFTAEIRPILLAHCAPCHEPGGKMYARLPFDDPSVLSSHEPGVKKRLKGDDLKAFERWLAMAPEKS